MLIEPQATFHISNDKILLEEFEFLIPQTSVEF